MTLMTSMCTQPELKTKDLKSGTCNTNSLDSWFMRTFFQKPENIMCIIHFKILGWTSKQASFTDR